MSDAVKTMTRAEVIAYMKAHPYEKISHHLFDKSEYVYMADDGMVYDEAGNLFEDWGRLGTGRDGMRMRFSGQWEEGWSLSAVNEDGTPYEPPANPLKDKWDKLYPPVPMPQYSQVCDGYSCMWCGRCPSGELWQVPEEDEAAWEAYQAKLRAYNREHSPSLYLRRYGSADVLIERKRYEQFSS